MASQNVSEVALSGKFARTLFSTGGNLVAYNFQKWEMQASAESLNTTGFEDAGWHDGQTGILMAKLSLQGPYQATRSDLSPATIASILIPSVRVYYELWLAHPEWIGVNSLLRFAGIAQVLGNPVSGDVTAVANLSVELESRGPIYMPGQVSPGASALLTRYYGVSGAAAPNLIA